MGERSGHDPPRRSCTAALSEGGRTDYFDTSARPTQTPVPDTISFDWGARLPTLRTPRLALRSLTAADIADVFAVFSDPVVIRYWDGPLMSTREDVIKYLGQIHNGFRRREFFQWGIADASSDTVVGTCTLGQLSAIHQRCEIGFALQQGHWGKGLGSEAVGAVIDFAFEVVKMHRIEADVDPRNDRSLRLLERFGFEREGLLRERYYLHGERQDAVLMGLLRSNWRKRER
jgi:ribosomal-protein-alanine N-acetyltransferase